MFHTFRELPDDRKKELRQAFAELKDKTPEEREQLIDSEAYRDKFSPQERDILHDAASLADAADAENAPSH